MMKKIVICGLIVLFVALAFNPVNAIDEEGYIIDVAGIPFKIPNSFHADDDLGFDEDNTDADGDYVHLYGIGFLDEYIGEDDPIGYMIFISAKTRYNEPYGPNDYSHALGDQKTIAGKTGHYYAPEHRFTYVDQGVWLSVEAPNLEMIEYCINATS